ncbi:Gti1/Pac2 family-domain-containing protein, partial [Thamnocephalis sphaerospora]
METYHGYLDTALDALLLLEACRQQVLPYVTNRLDEAQRADIRSGQIFVWDQEATGIQRWTDGRRWSSSRPRGNFIIYRELCDDSEIAAAHARKQAGDSAVLTSAGLRIPVKAGGLIKRALSVTTSDGSHFHLVSYYRVDDYERGLLSVPRHDPRLRNLCLPEGLYPKL